MTTAAIALTDHDLEYIWVAILRLRQSAPSPSDQRTIEALSDILVRAGWKSA